LKDQKGIRPGPHHGFLRWVKNQLYADPIQAAVVEVSTICKDVRARGDVRQAQML
jgi:hypothetical protein